MSFVLIVISNPTILPKENEVITRLFKKGMQVFHLRKPGVSKKEIKKLLLAIPKRFHKRIVLHSHYSLLNEFHLKGIHYTEKTRKKKLPLSFRSKEHTVSASFHAFKDIQGSQRAYDYIFLSPVFDSISKKGYKKNFAEPELRELLVKKKNIFALGGVEPVTIKKIQSMGFKGAASLGYIWESKEPVAAYRRLVSKIK